MTQYRSNLAAIIKILKKKPQFRCTEEYKVHLRRTSFWTLFDVILKGNITASDCRKSDKFLREVILNYNQGDNSFGFGDYEFNIARLDIKLILGIVDGTAEITNDDLKTINPNEFLDRRFTEKQKQEKKNARELTTSKLREAVIEASTGQEQHDYEDTARLLVLYVMNTVFLYILKALMKWVYANYVTEMDKMCDFNWTSHIYNRLKKYFILRHYLY